MCAKGQIGSTGGMRRRGKNEAINQQVPCVWHESRQGRRRRQNMSGKRPTDVLEPPLPPRRSNSLARKKGASNVSNVATAVVIILSDSRSPASPPRSHLARSLWQAGSLSQKEPSAYCCSWSWSTAGIHAQNLQPQGRACQVYSRFTLCIQQ